MQNPVNPIPADCQGATPFLSITGAAAAIDFYTQAFGAVERYRIEMGGGMVGYAEITIGGALIMLADEFPAMGFKSPRSYGGSPVTILIYVQDVDTFVKRAIDAGAKVRRALQDQFYGDRSCQLEDPSGHVWTFASRREDLTPDEIKKRAAAIFGKK